MTRIVSIILIGIGAILFYIFLMTLIGSLDGGMYLIFEIILMIVWGSGTLLFGGVGLAMFKRDKEVRKAKKENE